MTRSTNATISKAALSLQEVVEVFDRLIMLEKAFGFRAKKPPLLPFKLRVDCDQIISIQHAATRVSKYLGLEDLTFLVRITEQSENVGGKIHLDSASSLVEIEIDPELFSFQEAVLATICHEITHRFLFRYGVKVADTLENEKLTDTAAVYLGLGCLMTNGCSCSASITKRTASGTVTETRSMRTGYLRDIEFAITHRLVCDMQDAPRTDSISNSSTAALGLQREVERSFPYLFPPGATDQTLNIRQMQVLEGEITLIQQQDSEAEKRIRVLKMALDEAEDSRRTLHSALREHQRQLIRATLEPNQSLSYLQSNKAILEISVLKGTGSTPSFKALDISASAFEHKANLPEVLIVQCPIDGRSMRVPSGRKLIKITCPECSYRFLCSTVSPVPPAVHSTHTNLRRRIIKKVQQLFGGRTN